MSVSTLARSSFPTALPAQSRPAAVPDQIALSEDCTDREIFAVMRAYPAAATRCRELLVARYWGLACGCARRYSGRAESDDDLRQVAFVGLLASIHRFDHERGNDFGSFARPTILGELRRHFRDARRWVRVPRRLQEIAGEARGVTEEAAQQLGRMPGRRDLARILQVDEREVGAALDADQFFAPASLDAPVSTEEPDATTKGDLIGASDGDLERVADLAALRQLLETLPDRERTIVTMTFYGNHTQVDIGRHLGISQMHVSRLLTRTLDGLREKLDAD